MMRQPWVQPRRWAGGAAAFLAAFLLAACTGGTAISQLPTPPEPAPIPLRKPPVPGEFLVRAPSPVPPQATAAPRRPATEAALPLPRRNPRPAAVPTPANRPAPVPPAPRQAAQSRQTASPQAAPAQSGIYIVQPGENVFSIARKHNVPIRTLLETNRLGPPYRLTPGQTLVLPTPSRHIVTRGETVYAISRRYRIDIHSLVQLNRIPPPFRISVGQVLDLPGTRNAFAAATPQPAPAGPTVQAGAQTAQPQTTETQTTQAQASTATVTSRTVPVPAAKPRPSAQPTPEAAAKPQMARVQPPKPSRRPAAGVPKPPPRSSSKFRWPLSGKILSSFGSKGSGVHNDGINIEAAAGTIVRAAENGVVAYSGNELRGFGRLLLVKHADGWVTAYAHLSEVLVARGETVKRGQAIAKVGRSGNVSKPQLHFEIRQGTRAVDPRKLLGPQQASLSD
ncbi:LysM peptidoglycan-binding domain-containing M23 family metallopeptidase [Denitrobaculum tricleocarpae]|uniref:LysM peptidoglycan-binding domain-containing M23 family metallopeptidase n=1 Tax=Denitrobaculum tricleocarpae TaxID=2591009 RepID=A0A545TPZ1_9PROT|nr:LysM peptidoglycan-binding domain-containing M23 family metallopeptidase [Denitrobaculum tricleocarpae]TQV79293.1 LysM peptidoglycan-binding domain-containing M23 family metallopeptidase [Denitrobaculum tricleocarpae]